MKEFFALLIIAGLAMPAAAGSCSNGKCLSPAKREALKKQNMQQRLANPVQVTPAMQKINMQIMQLSRTNVRGRNNAAINSLHSQRNQMVKSARSR